jgi:nucleoside 2-deoxyribosyltransferase
MEDIERVTLFFQFNSDYYNRNRLEKMVRDATDLARKNIPDVKIEYNRINIHPAQTIISEVIKYIDSASFCVFELSDNNPNVLFELGYAYSKGKGIALLKNRTTLDNLALDLSINIEEIIREAIKNNYNYLLRRIWSFKEEEKVIFVSGNLKGQYLVLPPDANALLEASLTVKTLYPNVDIERFYAIDLPSEYEDDMSIVTVGGPGSIVTVGGPSSNQVTRRFLDKVNFPWDNVRPTPDSKQIMVNKVTQQKIERLFDENGRVKRDFGFFMKIPNPTAKDKTVILIVALTTEGVWGCAKTFSYDGKYSKTNCNKLMESIGDLRYFAVITETVVENNRIESKPLSHEVYAYDPSENKWDEI